MSAESIAMSVPAPIAMPTFDLHQGRRVVDAVADHRHVAEPSCKSLLTSAAFWCRQQARVHFVCARLGGRASSGRLVVAADEEERARRARPETPRPTSRAPPRAAESPKSEQAEQRARPVRRDDHRRPSILPARRFGRRRAIEGDLTFRCQEARAPDERRAALDRARTAAPGDRLEPLRPRAARWRARVRRSITAFPSGCSEAASAAAATPSSSASDPPCRLDFAQGGLALGEHPSLVEHDVRGERSPGRLRRCA